MTPNATLSPPPPNTHKPPSLGRYHAFTQCLVFGRAGQGAADVLNQDQPQGAKSQRHNDSQDKGEGGAGDSNPPRSADPGWPALAESHPARPTPAAWPRPQPQFLNWGSVEGALGTVGLWLLPADAQQSPVDGGIVLGAPCDYNTFAATGNFSGVVVKPGKSKKVKIKDVPVPKAAGWWQVLALADAGCALPSSSSVFPSPGYAAFEVVAA